MTEKLLSEALSLYALENPRAVLIRHNENATHQVTDSAGNQYVLRIHQPREGFSQALFEAYQRDEALAGQLSILRFLASHTDIPVQSPVPNRAGSLVTTLSGGELVTLLSWLPGDTLEKTELTPALLREIGRMTATMHLCFRSCQSLPKPVGHDYDKALVLEMTEKLQAMEQAGWIPPLRMQAMAGALEEIARRMAELDHMEGSYGVVHSDLSRSNMILCGGRVVPIDFGLWGYGYYYMDLGSLASHMTDAEQQDEIFRGYESVSHLKVNRRYVAPFVCLGVLLFICTFAQGVHAEEWFEEALERWCNTLFQPLCTGDM